MLIVTTERSYDAHFAMELLAAREQGFTPRNACIIARQAAVASIESKQPHLADQRTELSQLAADGLGFSAR